MTDTKKIVDEAIDKLKRYSGLSVHMEKGRPEMDLFINIDGVSFLATVKSAISDGNRVTVHSHLALNAAKNNLPALIISGYIPIKIAKEYTDEGVNYLDMAGNCSIRYKNLVLIIEGKKKERISKTNQSRAFQEAGVRIIFHLLNDPANLNLPYRKLADVANVSLGSVSSVMNELIELNFMLATQKKRVLKNKRLLLDRWVTAYHDSLRPKLLLKKMRFTNPEQYSNWDDLSIQDADDVVLWGGEPAASLLTNRLFPEKFVIYTNGSWQALIQDIKLAPADDGEIEVLRMFWDEVDKFREKYIVPPLLIYADLMGSRIGRNNEIAKMILEDELSNIID